MKTLLSVAAVLLLIAGVGFVAISSLLENGVVRFRGFWILRSHSAGLGW